MERLSLGLNFLSEVKKYPSKRDTIWQGMEKDFPPFREKGILLEYQECKRGRNHTKSQSNIRH